MASPAHTVAKGYAALGSVYAKTLPRTRSTGSAPTPGSARAKNTEDTGRPARGTESTGSALAKNQAGTAPTKSGSGSVRSLDPDPGSANSSSKGTAGVTGRRQVQRGLSIDDGSADMLQQHVRNVLLPAAQLRTLKGHAELATDHLRYMRELIGSDGRSLVPTRTLRIGTVCTGSGAEVISLVAIEHAFSQIFGRSSFSYRYMFNCERNAVRQRWINALHRAVEDESAFGLDKSTAAETASASGLDVGPCLFDDIGDLHQLECKCYTHFNK